MKTATKILCRQEGSSFFSPIFSTHAGLLRPGQARRLVRACFFSFPALFQVSSPVVGLMKERGGASPMQVVQPLPPQAIGVHSAWKYTVLCVSTHLPNPILPARCHGVVCSFLSIYIMNQDRYVDLYSASDLSCHLMYCEKPFRPTHLVI